MHTQVCPRPAYVIIYFCVLLRNVIVIIEKAFTLPEIVPQKSFQEGMTAFKTIHCHWHQEFIITGAICLGMLLSEFYWVVLKLLPFLQVEVVVSCSNAEAEAALVQAG